MNRNIHRLVIGALAPAIVLLASAAAAFGQYGDVAPPPSDLAPGFDSMNEEQASDWLHILAGEGFEGRGTGQVGYSKAAHWVAGKLAEFGVEPKGEGDTYFQMMPFTRRLPDTSECRLVAPNGTEIKGEGNLGFERYTDQGEVTGEVAFVNLRGKNPTLPEATQLRDRIVIYTTDQDAFARAPRLLATQRPAASIRVIDGTPRSFPQVVFSGRRTRSTSVSGTIRKEAALQLADAAGVDANWSNREGVFPGQGNVTIQVRLREEQGGAPNVLGWIQGSDPTVNHEYVVIGCHLDHLGYRGGVIYPGADDNGSGSTAVLNIARAMALNPVKPRRSVLFIWFTGEESGLLGSRYYSQHPLLPVENMVCMFNMDMVGRNEDQGEGDSDADNEGHIHLVGSQRGDKALHDLILAANRHIGFEFEMDMESVWNRSDQVNFYNLGVPVAFLFGGFHDDYHQPSDTPDKINYKKVVSAARLYYLSLYAAAEHGHFKPNGAANQQDGTR